LLKERDKQCVTKAIVSELIQAIKFKCEMHEHNYMAIVELVLQDAGETISEEINDDQFNTAACEAIRPYLFDIIDFISDLHVLAKLKVFIFFSLFYFFSHLTTHIINTLCKTNRNVKNIEIPL
uniref:PUM-HD domain-containing protein n=1 Tax=Toxocara canis TaxID=6265 RepID=A0A183VEA5_TOXCA